MSERVLYTTPAGEQYVATITGHQPDGTISLQYANAAGAVLTASRVPLNPTGRVEGGHYYDLPHDALAILRDGLNAITLNRLARWAVRHAETSLPNQPGETKRRAAIRLALALVENVDHLIPLVGPWLDLPPADWAQKIAVGFLIDRAWAWGVNEGWLTSSAATGVGRP